MERKASDIILELESKINSLTKLIESMDFNLKLISNKLNKLVATTDNNKLHKVSAYVSEQPPITNKFEELKKSQSEEFEIDKTPNGQRRVSRPTQNNFSGPIQVPLSNSVKFVSNSDNSDEEFKGFKSNVKTINKDNLKKPVNENVNPAKEVKVETQKEVVNDGNLIKVSQRVFNEHGKAEFFADVSIQQLPSLDKIKGTRTTGTGLWSVMIPQGIYRVSIKTKQPVVGSSRINSFDINLDGTKKEIDLDKLII